MQQPAFSNYKKIETTVHGVTYGNRQDTIRRFCRAGMPVMLRREPNNPRDIRAISVWIKGSSLVVFEKDMQIGYIPSAKADKLAPIMDAGGVVRGQVIRITGGTRDKVTFGVVLELEVWSN